MYHPMDLHYEEGKQTYRQYAGLDTAEMRQRAIDHGCENDDEIEHWLDFNYGNDRANSRLMPYKFIRRRKKELDAGKADGS